MFLPAPGTLVANKYQLESLLGEGGMGAVYRARHVLMDKPVALKWLRPELCGDAEARERLMREARSVARIHHPNVVQIFDVDSHDGALFLVMELLEGHTLADLIAQQRLSTRQVIELLVSAMHGLSAAHERGIIHRDIKPENIFVVHDRQHPEGTAKLLDFGISKLADQKASNPRLTQTGHSIGTPVYMSVEQLTRGHEVDLRTDIYALGVVLYHALSGVLPFDGETFAGIVLSIATSDPRPLKQLRPELPAALDRIVMKAMARDRDDRYDSVDALIAALRMIDPVAGHPSPPRAYPATRTPGPPAPQPSMDLSLEASANGTRELVQGQKATTRRRLLIGLTMAFALIAGTLGLLRGGPRHSVSVATGGTVANTPAPPSLPSPNPSAPAGAPLPDVSAHAPQAASPADSARNTVPATPSAPQATPRTSHRGHREPSVHSARASRRGHDEPSAAPPAIVAPKTPTPSSVGAHEAATPAARQSETPTVAAPKRSTTGGLQRGDF